MLKIHLKENEFFNLKPHLESKYDTYLLKGARGCGKTFPVMKHIFEKKLFPFVYLRLDASECRHAMSVMVEQMEAGELLTYLTGIEGGGARYVLGRPQAGVVSIRYREGKDIAYKQVCYNSSIDEARKTKGFARPDGDKAKALLFDEYSSKPCLKEDIYKGFADIEESYFRGREHLTFLLTNNNNFQELFTDLMDLKFIEITKDKPKRYKNKNVLNYLEGRVDNSKPKGCDLVCYYYITNCDFVGIWRNRRSGEMVAKSVAPCEAKNPVKDNSIFRIPRLLYADEQTKILMGLAEAKLFEL